MLCRIHHHIKGYSATIDIVLTMQAETGDTSNHTNMYVDMIEDQCACLTKILYLLAAIMVCKSTP